MRVELEDFEFTNALEVLEVCEVRLRLDLGCLGGLGPEIEGQEEFGDYSDGEWLCWGNLLEEGGSGLLAYEVSTDRWLGEVVEVFEVVVRELEGDDYANVGVVGRRSDLLGDPDKFTKEGVLFRMQEEGPPG